MNLYFYLPLDLSVTDDEIYEFCRYMKNHVAQKISNNVIPAQFQIRESLLLESHFVNWTRKPKHIDMSYVGKLISKHIICRQISSNLFVITFDNSVFPYTRTRIEKIARLLNYGDGSVDPTNFISDAFRDVSKNINNYWDSYLSLKKRRIKVNERILVR